MRSTVLSFLLLSLWGGAAALAAWVVCRLLRRAHAPSRFLCWLWLAVGLRFVLPFGIPLALPRPQNTQLAEAADTVQALTQPELTAPDLLVHHTDRVASAGGGMGCGRGTAGRACRVGLPATVPSGGAGLQNAGWLLQRPLCARALYPGPAAAPRLPARRAGWPRPGRRHLARAHPHPPGRPADQAAILRRGLPALVQPAGVAGLPRV